MDLIDRQAAIEKLTNNLTYMHTFGADRSIDLIEELPSVEAERDTPKRVLWTGWKGYRDTRYKCPSCNKPVRNDDAYCHRCGQRLMFPKISFTPYVKGQTQQTIVRWDDEDETD